MSGRRTLEQYLEYQLGEELSRKVLNFLNERNCGFRISRPRVSKRGDFRVRGKQVLITVNQDENRFRFALTLAHELAHLETYRVYKNKVNPHGQEWKQHYRWVNDALGFRTLFEQEEELLDLFDNEYVRPMACSGIDLNSERMLSRFDQEGESTVLEDLEVGSEFEFRSHQYKKMETRRTRVLCLNLSNNKRYTINRASKVKPL